MRDESGGESGKQKDEEWGMRSEGRGWERWERDGSRGRGWGSRHAAMRRSFRTRVFFSGWVPRVCTLGWYAMPRQGMGFETRFDIEVERNRTGLKRRSARRSVKRTPPRSNPASPSHTGRLRGQRPQLQKIRIRNHHSGGKAATVAGHAGPGFHTWPAGHILQTPDANVLIWIWPSASAKKTFSETNLCGVPSERGVFLPGGFPGFAPWAGMRCPVRA